MGQTTTEQSYPVVKFENIPAKIKALKQWVLWGEKKIPLRVDEKPASTTTPSDWSDYETAEAAYGCSATALGLGFVFTKECGLVGIDLDDCFQLQGGLKKWALKVLSLFTAGYIEISPSGKGLHIIIEGQKPGPKCKRVVTDKEGVRLGEIEIYDHARYFTVTGQLFDTDYAFITQQPEALETLYWNVLAPGEKEEKEAAPEPPRRELLNRTPGEMPQDGAKTIRDIIGSSTQAPKFSSLTTGTLESALAAYGGDHSRAAYALTSIVAWYTDSWPVMDTIFRDSPLYSGKWAPDPQHRGGRARQGKWAALGPQQFKKQRLYHTSRGEVYSGGTEQPTCQFEASDGIDDKGNGKGEADYERHVDLLLDRGEVARDLLTGSLRIRDTGEWEPVFTRSMIGALRAECDVRGKPFKKTKLEDYLYRYEQGLERRLLIDLPEWDGRDRIAEMCACLTVSNVSADTTEELIKDWCAKLWGKIWQPERVQNRCVILSGGQGIGKDYWIKGLLGGLGFYLSDLTLSSRQTKESDLAVVMGSHICLFISEFDKTEDIGVAALKDLITKEFFTAVRKYDRDSSRMWNRCSVIGACNQRRNKIFRDVTGNRRFLLFELDGGPGAAIRWQYEDDKDSMLQRLAQAKALWDAGYKASSAAEAEMRDYQAQHTPECEDEELIFEFESALREKIAKDEFNQTGGLYRYEEIEPIISSLAKRFGRGVYNVQKILAEGKCKKRGAKCVWYGLRETIISGIEPEDKPADSWESELN